jgi:hypothetical protein
MTQFQLVCAGIFVFAAALVYRAQLLAGVKALLGSTPASSAVPEVQQSVAVALVKDILSVTQLRDKLAAEQCTDGVEACTVLLRVLVEYKEPSKGVV